MHLYPNRITTRWGVVQYRPQIRMKELGLNDLAPFQFEFLVAELLRKIGNENVEVICLHTQQ